MKILVTCALPYANGTLHFGHLAGACLPAEIFARYQRFLGEDVLFLSGSDEFGVAITMSAELEGRSAQQQADFYHAKNSTLFERLDFSFDHFTRTSNAAHVRPVERFFRDLKINHFVEQRNSEQLYCEEEGRFLSDRYVVGTCPSCGYDQARGDECTRCGASFEAIELQHPKSKRSMHSLTRKLTTHWYLRLDLFRDRLAHWISKKRWKPNVMHFAAAYIRDLKPRSITRDARWGVPVPKMDEVDEGETKVFYVWFDAPIGYISAAMEWAQARKTPEAWKDFWCDDATRFVQFLGKDNIPFHAAIFPAMCMGQDQPLKLVDDLVANEFYHLEGRKLSKSEGWSVDLDAFLQRYSSEQLRYFLAATAPESGDAEFTWKEFQARCNAELVGKLGNFVYRTLSFVHAQMNGEVPTPTNTDQDRAAMERARHLLDQLRIAYDSYKLRRAAQLIMELASWGNVYFDANKPWLLIKEERTSQLGTVLFSCCEMIRLLAIAVYPMMPRTAQAIWQQLGLCDSIEASTWAIRSDSRLTPGQKCPKPSVLFGKIEDEQMNEEREKLQSQLERSEKKTQAPPSESTPAKPPIDFQHFQRVDLRVGQIVEAKRVEKSSKLLHLHVDVGDGIRPVVAGLAKHFTPEDLLQRKVAVVANLAPANIFGIESRGMLLVGQANGALIPLDPGNLPNGSSIT